MPHTEVGAASPASTGAAGLDQQEDPQQAHHHKQQQEGDQQHHVLEGQHEQQAAVQDSGGKQREPEHAEAPPQQQAEQPQSEEDDELEPQLKYERLGCDVKTILQGTAATCLCLSEKVLALGTAKGSIHILDYSGNEVGAWSLWLTVSQS